MINFLVSSNSLPLEASILFNGDNAFQHASYQMSLEPRIPGSEASRNLTNYMKNFLLNLEYQVELQEFDRFQ